MLGNQNPSTILQKSLSSNSKVTANKSNNNEEPKVQTDSFAEVFSSHSRELPRVPGISKIDLPVDKKPDQMSEMPGALNKIPNGSHAGSQLTFSFKQDPREESISRHKQM